MALATQSRECHLFLPQVQFLTGAGSGFCQRVPVPLGEGGGTSLQSLSCEKLDLRQKKTGRLQIVGSFSKVRRNHKTYT